MVCHRHPPPALQSIPLEEFQPFQFGPSAREDTHEHLLSPHERRGLNAPVAHWRAYTDSNKIKGAESIVLTVCYSMSNHVVAPPWF